MLIVGDAVQCVEVTAQHNQSQQQSMSLMSMDYIAELSVDCNDGQCHCYIKCSSPIDLLCFFIV